MKPAYEYLLKNAPQVVIAILVVTVPAYIYTELDKRHEPKGAVVEMEKRTIERDISREKKQLRREIRRLEAYEQFTPDSAYAPARQMELRSLEDELRAIDE